MNPKYDVAVIGGGPAGLAAACAASDRGASVCLIEREERLGGILKQCIHDGFGLVNFNEGLTGPEYAWRYETMVRERSIDIYTRTFLTGLENADGYFTLGAVNGGGLTSIRAGSLVAATGCRERTDRQIFIHGERPAGVLTAGQAQDLINLKGLLPGKRCVILGSGDIGLIMARRITLEGAKVLGVYEIGSVPSGLNRNIAQCLEDFNIPLHLRQTVSRIHGKQRVEGVSICSVDSHGHLLDETEEFLPCDSLILSVGLIPENDLIRPLGLDIDPVTGGPVVDQDMHTTVTGLFSCGNALHVNDLADYVSDSGMTAGKKAAEYILSPAEIPDTDPRLSIETGSGIGYVVPRKIRLPIEEDLVFFFRVTRSFEKAEVQILQGTTLLYQKKLNWLKPAEMLRIEANLSDVDRAGGPMRILLTDSSEENLK